LVYHIPPKAGTTRASEKRLTTSAFRAAFEVLTQSGSITRRWFAAAFPELDADGGCNFTTLGGVFVLIGEAHYGGRGVYRKATGCQSPQG
jgi:hypothetical protein